MKLFDFAIIIALGSAFTLTGGAEFFFEEPRHKFPDTQAGVELNHDFHFKNAGDEPLLISTYKVACSCTRITFPKEPIAPGAEGIIHLSFDTSGKYGFQNRKIELYSNASENPYVLTFKVYVVANE
jgi:hypothetical protein